MAAYAYVVWREGRSYLGYGGEIIRAFASEAVATAFAALLNAPDTSCHHDGDPDNPAKVVKIVIGQEMEDLIKPPELLE